jgi:hypothetical protein
MKKIKLAFHIIMLLVSVFMILISVYLFTNAYTANDRSLMFKSLVYFLLGIMHIGRLYNIVRLKLGKSDQEKLPSME